jgi:hypothetical protein
MYAHYTFTAEIARQRQAEYAAQAAARRRHGTVRRDRWGRAQARKHWPRSWPVWRWHPWPRTAPADSPSD